MTLVAMLRLTRSFPELYSEGSREPELGGPCTVEDSFEPLGVFVKIT
jgi:hypothetical protein